MRKTNREIEELVAMLNARLPGLDYSIDHAYGGVRLMREGGARDVSPRLTKGELYDWITSFIAGIDAVGEFAYKVKPRG